MRRFVLGFVLGLLVAGGGVYAAMEVEVYKVTGDIDWSGQVFDYESGNYIDVMETISFQCRGGYIDTDGYGKLRRCESW